MAGASISGLSSGLDTATIISQLMQLEAMPRTRLKSRVSSEESAITALQGFNTKLSVLGSKAAELAKPTGWTPVTTTSSYDKVTLAASGASPASLTFTVDRTAASHVLSFNETHKADDVLLSGESKLVYLHTSDGVKQVDTTDGTLKGLADAINAENRGVRATLVKVGQDAGQDVFRLQLAATTTGASSSFTVSTDEEGLLDLGTGFTTVRGGQDAKITVGTDEITSASNTFRALMPGVDVTLAADAKAATVVDVTVATDPKKVSSDVKALIDQLNTVLTDIDAATQSKTSTRSAGVLAGDSSLRSARDALVGALYSAAGGSLAEVGIQLDKYGKFTFSETTFQKAFAADPVKTASVFTQATTNPGFAERLAKAAKSASDPTTGTVTAAVQGRRSTVEQLNDSIGRGTRVLSHTSG